MPKKTQSKLKTHGQVINSGNGLGNKVTLLGQPTKGSNMMYGKGITSIRKKGNGYQL